MRRLVMAMWMAAATLPGNIIPARAELPPGVSNTQNARDVPISPAEALRRIAEARGLGCPQTLEQRLFVLDWRGGQ